MPVSHAVEYVEGDVWEHGLKNFAEAEETWENFPRDFVVKTWQKKRFMKFVFYTVTGMSHTPAKGKKKCINNPDNPLHLFPKSDFAFAVTKRIDNESWWEEKIHEMLAEKERGGARERQREGERGESSGAVARKEHAGREQEEGGGGRQGRKQEERG